MLAVLVGSKSDRSSKIIKDTVGYYLYFYYTYIEKLHCRPSTIDDLVNCLLYIQAMNELREIE